VYEASLRRNARDSVLASKVGQALIKTHNYNKAIIYYETALKSDTQQFLRNDLAQLFLKLRQFEKAEKVIKVALDREESTELSPMIERVENMKLLARVHRDAKQLDKALSVLVNASELQAK
jgi:tetratricopeptide repeat protein 21B